MDPLRPLLRLLAPIRTAAWWPSVRALLVLLHLVAVCAVACPAPVKSVDPRAWKRPSVQQELRRWSERLGQVGVHATPEELQVFSSTVQTAWTARRKEAVRPFQSYLRSIGTPQGWYMFTGPDREPQRFVLSATTTTAPDFAIVFELGSDIGRDTPLGRVFADGFVDDHRVRRALFQSSWSPNDNLLRRICRTFNARLRDAIVDGNKSTVVDVRCSLVARAVEHPAQRGGTRDDRVAREITINARGDEIESRDGAPPTTTRAKKPPAKKPPPKQKTPKKAEGGAP